MSHFERGSRRITSIPPRTSLDVLRGGVTIRIGEGSLLGGVKRVSQGRSTAGEPDWNQIVAKHVVQKPLRREKVRSKLLYEGNEKIDGELEVIGDYNGEGDLGIILQFSGIRLAKAPFLRSRHNRPDSPVFYMPVEYSKRIVRLFLATRGDVLECQITPAQMDVKPFFQRELYLPQLTTTHDCTSMAVFQNNRLITVGYNPRPTG